MDSKKIKYFVLESGTSLSEDCLESLEEKEQVIVFRFIERLKAGGAKKSIKSLKDGIYEIKIDRGPGYRIYFAQEKNTIILLLLGGNKGTQKIDIKKAKEYWREYGKQK